MLVTTFRRIGFSENAGWGLRDVFKNWRELGKIPPEINNNKARKSFELILHHEQLLSNKQRQFQKQLGLNLPIHQAEVFAFACKNRKVSIYDIRNILGKSLRDCHQLTELFVSLSLFQKIHSNFFELSLEIIEQLKLFIKNEAHDNEAHDEKEAHDVNSN